MANEQIALSFGKGITNVPSDATCDDNSLEECIGMVYENGEHKPIQNPAKKLEANCRVLFIHKNGTQRRYICIIQDTSEDTLCWGVEKERTGNVPTIDIHDSQEQVQSIMDIPSGEIPQVTAVGKTLVINCSRGIRYYLWKENAYSYLDDVPMPDMDYLLTDFSTTWRPSGVDYSQRTEGIVGFNLETKPGKQDDWNNIVVGLYSRNKREAEKLCRFIGPFYVRAAVRMYDGTYSKLTAPVLMVPTMAENTTANFQVFYNNDSGGVDKLEFYTWSCLLKYKLKNDYSAYRDIVDNVTLFVSKQIETLDITGNQRDIGTYITDGATWDILSIREYRNQDANPPMVRKSTQLTMDISITQLGTDTRKVCSNIKIPEARTQRAINDDLEDVSLFYKLADIGLASNTSQWKDVADVAREHALETLTEQEQLQDEYFGQTKMYAGFTYVYNGRLNLANVTRTIFNGFTKFMPYDNESSGTKQPSTYHAYVSIDTVAVVKQIYTTSEKQGLWFYYPDSRARRVQIFKQNGQNFECILNEALTEHKGLNGAYFFRGLPVDTDYIEQVIPGIVEPSVTDATQIEELPNTIVTSVVNNPLVFKAEGYNEAGVGKIMAMSTSTKALSQGQFGQYPLIIFSEEGIWAMSCDKTGLFVSIQPLSREVCNNANSVTQTDGAVFFSSEKGLMVIVGAEVKCVSEQLSTFPDFLRNAFLAYDYRDSLLWIFKKKTSYCYVYSINSGTIAKYSLGNKLIGNVINDYPDNMLQTVTYFDAPASDIPDYRETSELLSLIDRPLDHNDTGTYAATIYTRPMKFENALALKSIRQIRNVSDMEGSVTYRLFASNDLKNWVGLRTLRGMPWKYYKMRFDFSGLKATDRFAGTVVVTQERRTNKLR